MQSDDGIRVDAWLTASHGYDPSDVGLRPSRFEGERARRGGGDVGSDDDRVRRDHRGRLVLLQGPPIVLGIYLGLALIGFLALIGSTPDRATTIGAMVGGALAGVGVELEGRWRAKRTGT